MTRVVAVLVHFLMLYFILAKKILRIDKYEICGTIINDPIILHNMTLQYTRDGGFSFCGEVEMYRDLINEKIEVIFSLQRCASREALDTCEILTPLKPPNFCHVLDLSGLGFDEFRNGFEPPFRCPFKKGIYKIKNATINPELFRLLPLEGSYWKLNASIYENNYVGSLCFEGQVIVIRN